MKKLTAIAAAACVMLFCGAGHTVQAEGDSEETSMNITVRTDYGHLRLMWGKTDHILFFRYYFR